MHYNEQTALVRDTLKSLRTAYEAPKEPRWMAKETFDKMLTTCLNDPKTVASLSILSETDSLDPLTYALLLTEACRDHIDPEAMMQFLPPEVAEARASFDRVVSSDIFLNCTEESSAALKLSYTHTLLTMEELLYRLQNASSQERTGDPLQSKISTIGIVSMAMLENKSYKVLPQKMLQKYIGIEESFHKMILDQEQRDEMVSTLNALKEEISKIELKKTPPAHQDKPKYPPPPKNF